VVRNKIKADVRPTGLHFDRGRCFKNVSSVARSQQAFTATPAQNHGHLATFHGHKIVQNGYIHGHFNKENYLIKGTLSLTFFYPLFNGLSHLV
jgi:hypothetical protein